MRRYFAYGSNMDAVQMLERCPQSEKVEIKQLDGYEFFINGRHYANIRKKDDKNVFGIIYNITENDEENLNRCEGVQYGTNTQEYLPALDAFCYIAADTTESHSPKEGYLEKIIKAAKGNGFPPEYVEELKKWSK